MVENIIPILITFVCSVLFALVVLGIIKLFRSLVRYLKRVKLYGSMQTLSVIWYLDQEYDERNGRIMIWRPEFVDFDGDERFLLHNSAPNNRAAGLYKSWMVPATEDYRKVQLSYKEVR